MKQPDWIPPNVEETNEPLLVIKLDNEIAVPKVFYEGKEITGKIRVSFDWETKTEEPGSGGVKYNVDYVEPVNGEVVRKGYGLARGKYAFD
ncbi:hypothetical protein M3638_02950 [Oceanobacillus profundus]|uniref:hypothetical protein n=1 Tax=Oceanobacillus profundus TaxID=372463 RepID=UPI002040B0C5|nr:hypothetical protein [Oceanobacillus profundus]MCM3396797.1 hypothetical protein [Oceanobacillus profundus]